MALKKKETIIEVPTETGTLSDHMPSEKERLLDLLKTLQDLNIRSISDLENKIARA